MSSKYLVYTPATKPPYPDGNSLLNVGWDSPLWQQAEGAAVGCFHPASSDHRPQTRVRLLYDSRSLYVDFRVADRYVLLGHTKYLDPVYRDSCVEFFVQPRATGGYFNFEINCGGALLLYFIEDSRRTPDGFVKYRQVAEEDGRLVRIRSSMPPVVFPERSEPLEWRIRYHIPLEVLEPYTGPLGELPGQVWRGNFFKCADDSSHPHWASWSPIGEELNFHQPCYFGTLEFVSSPRAT